MAILLFGLLFIFMLIGLPIAFSLIVSSVLFLNITELRPLIVVVQHLFSGMDSFPLLAIPLFILMGNFMSKFGLSKHLIDWVNMFVGQIKGAYGMVAVIACVIFGSLTGSAPATVAAIGTVMIPLMIKDNNYPPHIAAGLVATSGTLGNIIPPSIALILFGATVSVSIPDLFIGSILPGVLLAISFIIVNYILARKLKLTMNGKKEKLGIQQVLSKTLYTIPVLLLPFIILGGIYLGIFTPTESAVVGVMYAFILGLFYRKISLKALTETLKDTVEVSAMVGFLIGTAGILGWILSSANIPKRIANNIIPLLHNEVIFFIVLLIFLIIVGMVMDPTASIVIFAPIVVPIGINFGIDPIHLGVVFCTTIVIGFVTPPFGLNIFTTMSISKLPFEDVVRGIIPFLVIALVVTILITFVPSLVTWLPNLL